jgi:hypothetical protein
MDQMKNYITRNYMTIVAVAALCALAALLVYGRLRHGAYSQGELRISHSHTGDVQVLTCESGHWVEFKGTGVFVRPQ